MKLKVFILLSVLTSILRGLHAQAPIGNLEFIENKGQWDSLVRFRAEMPNSTFYLHKHGFSVLLQSPVDMDALRQYMHGFSTTGNTQARTAAAAGRAEAGKTSTQTAIMPAQPGYPGPGEGDGQGPQSPVLVMHSHVYQVEFLNSSEQVEISGDKPLDTYNNYFIGNDSTKWRSQCKVYQAIVYKNIYPKIDLRFYTENDQLKYDLVVHPGGNPDNIILKYKGVDKLGVRNGQINIHTSVGDVQEMIPRSYTFSHAGKKDVECAYKMGPDQTVRFRISNYSPESTLIIDPTLVFSSFTGSHSDNWGYTATYDESGNFYSGSITLNSEPISNGNLFPYSPGAYQTKFMGGNGTDDGGYQYDITIMKFSSNGVNRLYATYLGGNGNEQPHSLVADQAGNLVIAGRTSSSDFPSVVTGGAKDLNKGGYDIILVKLNAGGTGLIGSRIIGGSANDGVNIAPKYSRNIVPMGQNSLRLNYGDDGRSEVILDKAGNVYLASCTSSSNFPVSANAFQKNSAGLQDGVFIKTSPDLGTILASTYLGGNNDDAAFALALNPLSGNVFIAGGTSSGNLPGTGNGPVISSSNKGGIDGFLSIVSNDGGTLIKTSYLGTSGTEVLYGVQFDSKGFPYIMGTTTGAWPIVNAAFSQTNGKQFIAKLRPDISNFIYSTTFGKGSSFPDISPTAFLVDRCENVYVAGWGGGLETEGHGQGAAVYNNSKTTGLTVTPNALKKTTDGDDFYFFVLKKDAASQLYGSFFGQNGGLGDHVDGGTSRFDKQGIIYEAICANCYGRGTFPTTLNVWSPKNGTGVNGCNLAAVKISLNFAGVAADPRSLINGRYDSSGCVPLDVLFRDTVHNAKLYVWRFGDGSPDTTTTSFEVMHTYTSIGVYTVRLIAIDSTTCNISDTAYLRIRVRTDKAFLNFTINKLPPCDSLKYLFTNISIPPAGKPFKPGSFNWNFGDGTTSPGISPIIHSYAGSGTYNVQLILSDTNYCNYPDTTVQVLRVSPIVKAQFEITDGCAPYDAFFNNTSLAGQSFLWNFGDGNTSTEINPEHIYPDTGTFTISLLVIDSNTCNVRGFNFKNHSYKPKAGCSILY